MLLQKSNDEDLLKYPQCIESITVFYFKDFLESDTKLVSIIVQ